MPVGPIPENPIGFLRSCLVEGDSLQERRARRSKQRALFISIVVQLLILTALVVFPLFSKGENIATRVFVPTVPFSPGRQHTSGRGASQPAHGRPQLCRFCAPGHIPPTVNMHDHSSVVGLTVADGIDIPGTPAGPAIPGTFPAIDSRHDAPVPPPTHRTERVRVSEPVINARLVRRIEPVYPPLAMQLRREGRVELHAIIATDGTIQSLEVESGEALFIQSALAAVREWRYQPTILDGQPIEVDTHITVIYSLNR
ncbi:MAG TPA: energy transducer TonB [Candidatus Sulfotelmatobacter sp.]|nr:energy transducer TonB [Candidatus Sulfotelmatobacter sp.]